jgi:peptidoglycan DL-endopeptidase CwlO
MSRYIKPKQKTIKNMRTATISYRLGQSARSGLLLGIAVVVAFASVGAPRLVGAEPTLEEQVRALQQENNNNRAAVANLMQMATSYQDAINQLQAQINQLQAQINENEAQKAALEKQINDLQLELERQKEVLGQNIKAMYVGDKMSTIEMLATSKDLSDFVDKSAYRNAVQRKIQDTLERITKLQNELGTKKTQIEVLLASLQSQRATVNSARAEQASLLAMNKQQQAEFNTKTSANQAKINDLNRKIAAQRAANNSGVVPDGGVYFIRIPGDVGSFDPDAYPFKNAGFSMQEGPCSFYDGWPDSPDGNGYCTRQCVSYAAWAVGASGRTVPKYWGNAKDWVRNAPASWVHREPQVGDLAITTAGTWGHAMYVEQIDGNRIMVSQYNQQLTGQFSYQWRVWR